MTDLRRCAAESMGVKSTRRKFLIDCALAGGIAFTGCEGLAQSTGRQASRRVIATNGRRIRTVDVHTHCLVPEAAALLSQQPNRRERLPLTGEPLDARIAAMDQQGIDVSVLSINLNWYDADRDLATHVVTLHNEALSGFCASHRDRFAAFASVALQFPDLAAEQLETAVRKLGFRGVAIGTMVAGRELSDASLRPFWAKAEELGVLVFIHPLATADPNRRLAGNGALANAIGNPLELTIALSHLIFEGTLDRHPGLKICAAHGGGYLPSYMHRSDRSCAVFPEQCTAGQPKLRPSEYLKRIYYDSIVFTDEGLRHLAAEVGAQQILLGTDAPYPWVDAPVDLVLQTRGLKDSEREAILGGTARRLLGLG
jgi:aminocarboxymuconate-semialdehyde decarboxylase